MKKIIPVLITCFFLIFSYAAYSADEVKDGAAGEIKNEYKNFFGFEASSISGIGISYGYLFLPDYMFKVCGFFVETSNLEKDPEDENEEDYFTDTWWNLGAEVQKTFFRANVSRSLVEGFGLAGGSFWYSKTDDPFTPGIDDKSRRWNFGFGLGMRAVVFRHLSIDITLGYQYSRDFEDEERYTGVAGSAGAHFLF